MAKVLPNLQQLRVINFGDCLVRPGGAKAIAEAIKDGHPLLQVCLCSGRYIHFSIYCFELCFALAFCLYLNVTYSICLYVVLPVSYNRRECFDDPVPISCTFICISGVCSMFIPENVYLNITVKSNQVQVQDHPCVHTSQTTLAFSIIIYYTSFIYEHC